MKVLRPAHALAARRRACVRPERGHHGEAVAGREAAAAREGVQVHRAGAPAGRDGHRGFCCATVREMMGMAAAGLGDDLLLANESLDLRRLTSVIESGSARITVAVDSEETIAAAVKARVPEVLIDVNVGLPRCGCEPDDAGRLADLRPLAGARGARRDGLRGPPHARARRHQGRPGRALDGAPAPGGRGGRRRHRVRRRHGHLGHQQLGHRAPGRQLLPDGHRVHAARLRLRERAVRAGHRHLEERPLGRARRRAQGVRHGPRRPEGARRGRLLVRVRRAHHLRPRRGHRRRRSATACG